MASVRPHFSALLSLAVVIVVLPCLAEAFGAGNIGSVSRIEGQNWRHGDIEDTLLNILMARAAGGKKFSKLDVKRVYFGNWLRDYSQAVDVGTVKYVSAEAIRIILWILGFLSFGYGTKEFEVTTERLGCYRPEEHIDNPKDYADNIDARQYDRRLRGPVDERRELSIDQRTGLKMYIASEDAGINTSAGLIRHLFGKSIQLGRRFARTQNNDDLYEALRLLGTGCHCLEDYSAHSNYVELALRVMGERDIFPHVGAQASVNIHGLNHPVFPIVTGTFGGVDFFHSVLGEFSDKATQSEIQELEGTVAETENKENVSFLKQALSSIPAGIIGSGDQAGKADQLQAQAAAQKLQNTHISPRQPEAWTRYLDEASKEIYPILEFHDDLIKSISETIDKIPVLPEMIDKLQEQINVFVFSLLAPYVLPILNQVKSELATGSSEVIQSSRQKQLVVFYDNHSTDPTHSMLSKDHFSNILNEPAGRVASQVLKWVVPQLMECWDNEHIDIDRTINRIVNGVFHHPAMKDVGNDGSRDGRQLMFQVVEQWWHSKSENEKRGLRDQLSRDGVEKGRNHKEGVHDQGHGCGKPLGMPNLQTAQSSGAVGGSSANAIFGGLTSSHSGPGRHGSTEHSLGTAAASAVGGGVLGSMVGGIVENQLGGSTSAGGGGGGHGGHGHRPDGRQAAGDAFASHAGQYQQGPPSHGAYPPQHGGYPPPQQYAGYPPPQHQGNYPPPQQHGNYPPQQHGNYPPQHGGYPPQAYGRDDSHHHKSDSEDSESKSDKKERKRMEKEQEKAKKQEKEYEKSKKKDKDDKKDKKKDKKHSDDDSDDSHGEYDRYHYENQYQRENYYPQGAAGESERYSHSHRQHGGYEEGLAYGNMPTGRRDDYDDDLAYGGPAYTQDYRRQEFEGNDYAQQNQLRNQNQFGGQPYDDYRPSYDNRQEYGQPAYGGQQGQQFGQSYGRTYDERGDGGYGPGEDQRYGGYETNYGRSGREEYYDDDNDDERSYGRRY